MKSDISNYLTNEQIQQTPQTVLDKINHLLIDIQNSLDISNSLYDSERKSYDDAIKTLKERLEKEIKHNLENEMEIVKLKSIINPKHSDNTHFHKSSFQSKNPSDEKHAPTKSKNSSENQPIESNSEINILPNIQLFIQSLKISHCLWNKHSNCISFTQYLL